MGHRAHVGPWTTTSWTPPPHKKRLNGSLKQTKESVLQVEKFELQYCAGKTAYAWISSYFDVIKHVVYRKKKLFFSKEFTHSETEAFDCRTFNDIGKDTKAVMNINLSKYFLKTNFHDFLISCRRQARNVRDEDRVCMCVCAYGRVLGERCVCGGCVCLCVCDAFSCKHVISRKEGCLNFKVGGRKTIAERWSIFSSGGSSVFRRYQRKFWQPINWEFSATSNFEH